MMHLARRLDPGGTGEKVFEAMGQQEQGKLQSEEQERDRLTRQGHGD